MLSKNRNIEATDSQIEIKNLKLLCRKYKFLPLNSQRLIKEPRRSSLKYHLCGSFNLLCFLCVKSVNSLKVIVYDL